MNDLEIIKSFFKDFVSIFKNPSFHIGKNVSIFKTGIDHWSMNFCFIDNALEEKDIQFIKSKLNVQATIFSEYDVITEISEHLNFQYLGEFPFVKKEEFPDFYKVPIYDDIKILSVREDPFIFDDFVEVFEVVRKIEKGKVFKKIDIKNLKNNNHFFVAYANDKPIGTFYFISSGDTMFVLDSSIRENYENYGIYNAFLKHIKQETIANDIFNYYSILTSEFSERAAINDGYKIISSYLIWKTTNDIIN